MNIQISKNIAKKILKILEIEIQYNENISDKQGHPYTKELRKIYKNLSSKLK